MFISDELIYIQMQKTASNHIVTLLSQLFEGQIIGKHNCASTEQIQTTPYFIASIRNPWDWYLSLWTFGVGGRGTVWERLTQKSLINLPKMLLINPKNGYQYYLNFLKKNTKKWQTVYQKNDDIAAFRQWLAWIHHIDNAYDLNEGYGDSNISHQVGFMTYRYLYLCCGFNPLPKQLNTKQLNTEQLNTNLADFSVLKNFDKQHCYINDFIPLENLGATLIKVLEKIRPLSDAEKSLIQNSEKTNTSSRPFPVGDYYNNQSIDLIANRDRLLIEKFNYLPPPSTS